MSQMCKLNCGV